MNAIFSKMSSPEALNELGSRFKAFRITGKKTQKDIADWAGVSLMTVSNFESGRAKSIDFRVLFALLKAVRLSDNLDLLIPDLTESPYVNSNNNKAPKRRIRHNTKFV